MQYYLCPRCQFRVPAKRNACTTCGFDLTPLKNAKVDQEEKPSRASMLLKLIGGNKQKEQPSQEKPALSQ
ncbi:MAG TPA: hypothetical protein V6C81_29185 [Planktothrix sp.]|jgi:hypothetical protein